jgi:hypothetical protein
MLLHISPSLVGGMTLKHGTYRADEEINIL